jgi:hypothetical protein
MAFEPQNDLERSLLRAAVALEVTRDEEIG